MPPSGVLGVLIIAWLWSPAFAQQGAPASQQYVLAGVFALLLYASILLHEVAHAVAARSFGFPVSQIVLWVLGGFTVYERTRPSPGREAVVALAGPLTTAAVAGLFAVAANLADGADPRIVAVLAASAWANGIMAAYNLLPGLPLDGGTVLKAAVWAGTRSEHRGTVAAAWAGRALAVLMIAIPLWWVLRTPDNSYVGLLVTGVIFAALLWSGATQSLRRAELEARLPGVAAGVLAVPAIPVPAELSLDQALLRVQAQSTTPSGPATALGSAGVATAAAAQTVGDVALVVVDPQGRPVGIVEQAAAVAVPEQRRAWVTVGALARSLDTASSVAAELAGYELVQAITDGGEPIDRLVVRDGLIVGVLRAHAVAAALSR